MTPEEAMDIARGTPPSFVNDDGRRAAVILADEVERLQSMIRRWALPRGTHRSCHCNCCMELWKEAEEPTP